MYRLALIFALAACGGKQSPPPPIENTVPAAEPAPPPKTEIEQAMDRMTSFADSMCRCADKACAESVQEGMTKWSTEMASKGGERDTPKPTEADMKRMTEIGTKYAECMTKAYGAGP